ncbi:NAD(P)-binding domain-containing protein [Streptomyces sp. SID685]|uniref:NAD(P)-binding domain-containing protein n=1 Tax=Streptomyces sp. SID685 TaxID=2690322 RepID=UPI0031FF34F3
MGLGHMGGPMAANLVGAGHRVRGHDLVPEALVAAARAGVERAGSAADAVAMMAKEAAGRAFEASLAEGIRFERRLFHAVFAIADQKEGMAAFVGKRSPEFRHR